MTPNNHDQFSPVKWEEFESVGRPSKWTFRLRKYAVTVMNNWTPMRTFWTHGSAKDFWRKHSACAYLYHWQNGQWELWEGPF